MPASGDSQVEHDAAYLKARVAEVHKQTEVEAGHFAIVRAPWNRAFLEELRDFPNSTKDDQVDALARAFNTLESEPSPATRSLVHHMVR